MFLKPNLLKVKRFYRNDKTMKLTDYFNRNDAQLHVTSVTHIHTTTYTFTHSINDTLCDTLM